MTDTLTPAPGTTSPATPPRRRPAAPSRRTLLAAAVALAVLAALAGTVLAVGGGSTVTRARLERSLPAVFANLYVQQAHLLGRSDVTAASLQPSAMCDKDGAAGPDVGPGGTWVCLMSWQDPRVPMPPEGYGKFELNVHSNDCWTASGPSKLTGYLTLTDATGRDVPNPLFEFDGCFDPNGDDSPTGVFFPSLTSVTSTVITPDAQGRAGVQIACGTGADGCSGTLSAMVGDRPLGGEVPYAIVEEHTLTIALPAALPAGAEAVSVTLTPSVGVGPTSAVTVPVQGATPAR